jgi:hypothetical protein
MIWYFNKNLILLIYLKIVTSKVCINIKFNRYKQIGTIINYEWLKANIKHSIHKEQQGNNIKLKKCFRSR